MKPLNKFKDIKINENLIGGKISLSYSLNENINLFISGSRGFKASGVNQNPRLSLNNRTFKPEYNDNVDIGYRYSDEQLAINFVAFKMNRTDLQVSLSIILGAILGPLFFFMSPEWSILYGGFIAGTIAFFIGEFNVK